MFEVVVGAECGPAKIEIELRKLLRERKNKH